MLISKIQKSLCDKISMQRINIKNRISDFCIFYFLSAFFSKLTKIFSLFNTQYDLFQENKLSSLKGLYWTKKTNTQWVSILAWRCVQTSNVYISVYDV